MFLLMGMILFHGAPARVPHTLSAVIESPHQTHHNNNEDDQCSICCTFLPYPGLNESWSRHHQAGNGAQRPYWPSGGPCMIGIMGESQNFIK